jgi:mycothiol system anti-sigma-R factor
VTTSDPPHKPDCSSTVHELHTFLDGEITDDKRQRIQAHLDECPPCGHAFDFEAELRYVIADRLRTEVPASLAQRIRRAIENAG